MGLSIGMSNYPDIFKSLLIRTGISLLVIAFACWMMLDVSGWGSSGFLFYGIAGFILVGVIMAQPISRLLAESSGNLFYPVRRQSGPLPMYSIPKSKRAQGLYEEAMDAYEKIAEQYPKEVKPYIQMIDIAIVNLNDPARAADIFQRGLNDLNNEPDIQLLIRRYNAICTRLKVDAD